jgi:hypothetical protein
VGQNNFVCRSIPVAHSAARRDAGRTRLLVGEAAARRPTSMSSRTDLPRWGIGSKRLALAALWRETIKLSRIQLRSRSCSHWEGVAFQTVGIWIKRPASADGEILPAEWKSSLRPQSIGQAKPGERNERRCWRKLLAIAMWHGIWRASAIFKVGLLNFSTLADNGGAGGAEAWEYALPGFRRA